MICVCVSVGEKDVDECLKALEGVDFAEIRMDRAELSGEDVKRVFSLGNEGKKLIATCRPGKMSEEERERLLVGAMEAGASHVDVEVDSKDEFKERIVKRAKELGCRVLVSYHDFEKTPKRAELEQVAKWCSESGADVVKIACKSNSDADNARLLGLLDSEKRMVVVGLGEKGKITRVVGPLLGSAFTFASVGKGKETAEGQMSREEMEDLLKRLGNE